MAALSAVDKSGPMKRHVYRDLGMKKKDRVALQRAHTKLSRVQANASDCERLL